MASLDFQALFQSLVLQGREKSFLARNFDRFPHGSSSPAIWVFSRSLPVIAKPGEKLEKREPRIGRHGGI